MRNVVSIWLKRAGKSVSYAQSVEVPGIADVPVDSLQCADCHHQASVTAGTFMHHSHVFLSKLFAALELDKNGNPRFLKMGVRENIQQKSVQKFANQTIESGTTILSAGISKLYPSAAVFDRLAAAMLVQPLADLNG